MMNIKIKIKACKITVFGILFSTVGLVCVAQNSADVADDLNKLANQMFVDVNNKDFDALLDMMHPKVYELVPKSQMKTIIKNMFEGTDEFSIEIPNEIPEYKISKVFDGEKNNLQYGFISYDMRMKMTFHNQEFDDEARSMMTGMMKAKGMDAEFISKNTLDVLMKDRLTIVLREDSTQNNWVLVNYDPDSPLSYKVLSSDLLEAAKEYNRDLMLQRKKNDEQ